MKRFDVTECAAYVHRTINDRYYGKLLAAIESEALRAEAMFSKKRRAMA